MMSDAVVNRGGSIEPAVCHECWDQDGRVQILKRQFGAWWCPKHRDLCHIRGPVGRVEYRAVGFDARISDRERETEDAGPVRMSRREAERDLSKMCDEADPPYDDAWIEQRTVTDWRKSKR